jgi:hypothetical protein
MLQHIVISMHAWMRQCYGPTNADVSVPADADAMRWNGPAPEVINGRLAMVGFVLGAMNESKTATPLEVQVLVGAFYCSGSGRRCRPCLTTDRLICYCAFVS